MRKLEGYFAKLISGYLSGAYTREYIAKEMTKNIGVNDIQGDQYDLLPNCEYALRHMNEKDYYTTDSEIRYYLDCLLGKRKYSSMDRDAVIGEESDNST